MVGNSKTKIIVMTMKAIANLDLSGRCREKLLIIPLVEGSEISLSRNMVRNVLYVTGRVSMHVVMYL